jgi:glucosamine--fructose-6-phosphate aminotransferase (isomerizing)
MLHFVQHDRCVTTLDSAPVAEMSEWDRAEREDDRMAVPTTDSKMYQTMRRQPADMRRLVTDGWAQADQAATLLAPARRVLVVGIGTSWHAAMVGGWLLRAAGLDARPVSSFDFALYPDSFPLRSDDAVVVMAHTGVKTYSAVAMRRANEAGAQVISVGSRTAEHPGSSFVLRTVEREQSAAYTASHLAAMTVLAQVATSLGEDRGAAGVAGFRTALDTLPDQIEAVLGREEEVQPVAEDALRRQIYAIGAGPNEATALELVIKAREAAYVPIDALHAEQFLHGPMVAFNAGDLLVVVAVPGNAYERVAAISAVAAAMGGALWIVGASVAATPEAAVFALPELPEVLSPLLAVVPMQMLAYTMAALRGINPDTFRRDDPRYKEAFGLLTL